MYPGMNHDLRFLLAHQPRAYAIDRTLGTNPIQQQLSNLNGAGSLYGNIIYHKSPVVMNQLEQLMGSDNFRQGLQKIPPHICLWKCYLGRSDLHIE